MIPSGRRAAAAQLCARGLPWDEILTKSGAKGAASFAAERQMGLSRGPPADPLGCKAAPKAAPSIRLLVLGAAGVPVCGILLTRWLLGAARRGAAGQAAQRH